MRLPVHANAIRLNGLHKERRPKMWTESMEELKGKMQKKQKEQRLKVLKGRK